VLARLRPDALHQPGAGRRSGAACRRPDVAHVLRLQRTIGNRATTRLLRQPTATEEEERARFDAAKRTHEQHLVKYAERKPHVLKSHGITTDSRVDQNTPKWIQAALAESRLLRPYLRGKFPAQAITDKFRIHTDEDTFNEAAKKHLDNKDLMNKAERAAAYGKIGGFYERRTNEVHVRSRTKFGHALHEAMHKVAHPVFRPYWQRFINEGVTQYFTDRVLKEQGLSEVTDHEYTDELACAKKLVLATSEDVVARAYFLNEQALREALMRRFQIDGGALTREIGAERICTRL
jgi:hypothetical protein